jgi:hypothetical protein
MIMRKKWLYFFLLLFMIITIPGCRTTKEIVVFNNNGAVQTPIPTSAREQIRDEMYHKDGIEASYPKFVTGGSEEQRNQWNNLISVDFNKIIHIYSFNPFPELTPSPTAVVPTILRINYVIKSNNSQGISIFYTADFNSPYSAHPTDLVYTTNIDKTENKRLKLRDFVKLSPDFVKNFRNWDFISVEEGNEELNQAIRDYMNNISDEDLLMGFEAADQIDSNNIWGIFSYLTPDKLGISVAVPNYIGDHVEFEREFSKLEDFLVPGFKWE